MTVCTTTDGFPQPSAVPAPAIMGAWLVISIWLWPHSSFERNNALLVGALIVIGSVGTTFAPAIRWVNAALAVWLFCSAFADRSASPWTMWNDVMIAIFVFIASVMRGAIIPPHSTAAVRR